MTNHICDACECVAHCRKNGCIPLTPLASHAGEQPLAVRMWHDRIKDVHPKSEPEYWPSSLKVEFMEAEILDLRAALAAPGAAIAAREQHSDLMRFYSVDSVDALIAAQTHHIEKLQSKLQPVPSLASQRIREG